jgi:putative nucleotidyltransferase with HDIG domain
MGSETSIAPTPAATTNKVLSFVVAVVVLAATLFGIVWSLEPDASTAAIHAALLLGALACVGEAYQFMLSRSAEASIAFIPYTALALVVPNWVALAAILAVKIAEGSFHKRSPVKAVFNVAQYLAMFGLAILAFRLCGGTPFLAVGGGSVKSFAEMSRINGVAGLVAFCVALSANMFFSNTVIALHAGVPVISVWRENSLPGLALSLLAAPMIFLFAWVYAAWGPIAAALTWVPILGYRHTMKATNELEQTNRELLELMIKSIEARDPYTSGHSRRVQHYATLIARASGLSEREIEHVSTSALLHDVGKIHEKYGKILTKEEKLSPEEWALMREHPIDGANLVATMTRLQQFVAPVRHHHENWDGTGYPDGLAGDLIPLASRIIMFADTIDAMTTARPYRGPLSEAVVRAEIVRRRGEQFDPRIADAILSSAIWRQLFVPAHASIRGHSITLAGTASGEIVRDGRKFARSIAHKVSND